MWFLFPKGGTIPYVRVLIGSRSSEGYPFYGGFGSTCAPHCRLHPASATALATQHEARSRRSRQQHAGLTCSRPGSYCLGGISSARRPAMAEADDTPFVNGVSLRPRSSKKRASSASSGEAEDLASSRYSCPEPGEHLTPVHPSLSHSCGLVAASAATVDCEMVENGGVW